MLNYLPGQMPSYGEYPTGLVQPPQMTGQSYTTDMYPPHMSPYQQQPQQPGYTMVSTVCRPFRFFLAWFFLPSPIMFSVIRKLDLFRADASVRSRSYRLLASSAGWCNCNNGSSVINVFVGSGLYATFAWHAQHLAFVRTASGSSADSIHDDTTAAALSVLLVSGYSAARESTAARLRVSGRWSDVPTA